MKDIAASFGSNFVNCNVGNQPATEAIRNSYDDGFLNRNAYLQGIVDTIRHIPSNLFGKKDMPFVCDFDWQPGSIDRSDNQRQVEILKHHYTNELSQDVAIDELIKDYSEDAVIYEVINNIPATYRGADGLRKSVNDFVTMLHTEDGKSKVELQHIKINHNHAQVTWKAETPHHTHIFGTDAFTFDANNRIKSQSIVAISEEYKPSQSIVAKSEEYKPTIEPQK